MRSTTPRATSLPPCSSPQPPTPEKPPNCSQNSPTSPVSEWSGARQSRPNEPPPSWTCESSSASPVFSIVGLLVFSRSSFLDPFRTVVGQAVLAAIFATFIVAIVWARRLAIYEQPGRFLTVRSTT